ncbi:DEAD/DEAH box helicase [Nocardia callitridis]|uniref:ATP-dependent helicase n=1 Tax=Nocardia callitridis TaxID=648753 RepID=A0ABP9L3R2_9NOCA
MLHGLWSPGSGLLLWGESAAASVPEPLGGVLRGSKFRHRAEVLVDGARHERVRAHALVPSAAARALRQRLPAETVSGDLRFLAHVALGVERWVRAGRVVPQLRRDDGQWWVRWRLVGGERQRAWLAELAATMPEALRVAGRPGALLDDMVTELADPIVRELIDPPRSRHPLIAALVADHPVEEGSHQVAEVLERWRETLTGDEPELVLRLLEPDSDLDEFESAEQAPSTMADESAALWRLEVCLRVDGEAPNAVVLHGDPTAVRIAVEQLGVAQQAYPRLRDLPTDPRSLDLLLPTEVVADLVEHGAHSLREAGIRLLLPRAWSVGAPSMRLRVDGAVAAAESTVGMRGLVAYRWELAVGDTVLTEAEMLRMIRTKSDLVRLRGEWVKADHKALAAAARYVAAHTDDTPITLADLLGELAGSRVDQVPISEVTATGWAAEILDGSGDSAHPVDQPSGLDAELRPYQRRGLTWLATMSRNGFGAILADDMGLGKTVQVLALLLHEREAHAQDEDPRLGEQGLAPPSGHASAGVLSNGAIDIAAAAEIDAAGSGRGSGRGKSSSPNGRTADSPVVDRIVGADGRNVHYDESVHRIGSDRSASPRARTARAESEWAAGEVSVPAGAPVEHHDDGTEHTRGADPVGRAPAALDPAATEIESNSAEPGPTLLVCPMSVVGNWQREAQRFAPGLRVWVHHGVGRLRGEQLSAEVAAADLVVTTYALLAKDVEQLREQHWERIVLDEAQHIKNSNTRQSRAARSLSARHRLALTGTPVENRLEELRSIMDFVMPKLLGSPQSFRARFAVPIERERDANAISRLRWITQPFVLRRVKTDPAVITDLPEKLEMTVRANLTAEQAALYQAVVDDMLAKIKDAKGMARKGAVLGALTRLKQVCNHPAHFLGDDSGVLHRGSHRSGKLALVEDVLDSVLADGEKALLFTQFREFGDLIAPYLVERFGTEVPFLHGGVPKVKRDSMVERFQEPDGPPLMLLSLKAGGTGLNLTAANHVVHLDRWWNPAVENQATDRAFRIGQHRNVQVRKLVCVDTIEERIDEMINGKRQLADLAVGTGENWITEMGTDDLRELFSLGASAVGE